MLTRCRAACASESLAPSVTTRGGLSLRMLSGSKLRKPGSKKFPKAEAERAKSANARLLYFQSTKPSPVPTPAPRSGKLVDPNTCPHLQTNYGHCDLCGESIIWQDDGVAWFRRKHG